MREPALVLDASALLALILGEPGADAVLAMLPQGVVSAVNLAEVVATMQDRGATPAFIDSAVAGLSLTILPFDADQARRAGLLRAATRSAGLSLGDRACLALAQALGGVAVTCDRAWAGLALDVPVQLLR